MNKGLILLIKIITTLSFLGLLICVAIDASGRMELVCCTVATVGTYILVSQKKKRKSV